MDCCPTRRHFVVESHDGTDGGVFSKNARDVLGVYGAVTNCVAPEDLERVPRWMAPPQPYSWQVLGHIPMNGPYDGLPIEPHRAALRFYVEDGRGGPFSGPMAASVVDVQQKTPKIRIPAKDAEEFSIVVYTPLQRNGAAQTKGYTLPVIVYIHGGCMALCGDPETYEGFLTRLAAATQHVVVWVGYRLAPEHRYPAALDDVTSALVWTAQHISLYCGNVANGVIVMGDSAGGNLALLVAKKVRDNPTIPVPRIRGLVPIYPMVDWSVDTVRYQSLREMAWMNTLPVVEYHIWRDMYLGPHVPGSLMRDPVVSPIFGELRDLPCARFYTAEWDTLRSEGEECARLMHEAGCNVTCVRMMGAVHPALLISNDEKLPDFAHLREWFFGDLRRTVLNTL